MTNIAASFLIFKKKYGMIFHENHHALFVIFEKQQNLKLLSAANYSLRLMG